MSGKSRHTGRAIVISALTVTILLMFGAGKEAEGGQDNRAPLPRFLGDSRSINVASSIGAVSDSLPIVVPPGRHSIEPRLTLSYSSMGGQGKLGLGWDIEIGRVERWRGDGVPPAPSIDTDRFTYSLGGAGGASPCRDWRLSSENREHLPRVPPPGRRVGDARRRGQFPPLRGD